LRSARLCSGSADTAIDADKQHDARRGPLVESAAPNGRAVNCAAAGVSVSLLLSPSARPACTPVPRRGPCYRTAPWTWHAYDDESWSPAAGRTPVRPAPARRTASGGATRGSRRRRESAGPLIAPRPVVPGRGPV